MKKVLLLVAMVLSVMTACGTKKSPDSGITVMTFNIRLDTDSDGENAWKFRKDNVGRMLNQYTPDILGMQEVLHNQLMDICKALPHYKSVGVGRSDGKEAGEYSPVLYNSERFELVSGSTFSLSEQPDKIGIKGWDAACERICSWAILKDVKTGKKLAVFNTHFDHMGKVARRESSKLMLSKIKEIAGNLPVVFMGDLNGTPDSEPIQIISQAVEYKDSRAISKNVYGPAYTFHDFWRLPVEQRELIDYIFVSKQISVAKYCVIDDAAGGFISDHNPVEVQLDLPF